MRRLRIGEEKKKEQATGVKYNYLPITMGSHKKQAYVRCVKSQC